MNTKTIYKPHARILATRVENWGTKKPRAIMYIAYVIDSDCVIIGKMEINTTTDALFEIERMAADREMVLIKYSLHSNGAIIHEIGGYAGK